ncbi:ZIP zinc transporter-domain-containing protein [Armillaria borealis]|uniref:ZIP zinc transporter-domain-containing protein n=1 Tax=Armillaria borealis TaxID=47425 RepID=A0AA39MV25_9AGAR|nr:ZIP zinc transporter-domain-containing protein [Armillaria borealis]
MESASDCIRLPFSKSADINTTIAVEITYESSGPITVKRATRITTHWSWTAVGGHFSTAGQVTEDYLKRKRHGHPPGSAVHHEDLQSRSHERNSVGPCCSQINLLSPATFSTYPGPVQVFFLPNTSASMHILTRDDEDALNCGSGGGADTFFGLRVASIFIISLREIFWKRCHYCLADGWRAYPYALALCMLSIVFIFILELIAFRWGTKKLAKIGMRHDAHGHQAGSYAAHGPEGNLAHQIEGNADESKLRISDSELDIEDQRHRALDSAMTQIIGVAILEFGVNLHSVFVGLTLAVDPDFKVLFVVLIFHQTFEGLGVGSRLAYLDLPPKYRWTPYAGAALYGLTTPIGIAAGLGVRTTYNPGSTTASIVSGTLDAFSSGILIYTGLVELLAHEFLFNKEMMTSSNGKLAYAIGCMLAGCGIMALLGRWA